MHQWLVKGVTSPGKTLSRDIPKLQAIYSYNIMAIENWHWLKLSTTCLILSARNVKNLDEWTIKNEKCKKMSGTYDQ